MPMGVGLTWQRKRPLTPAMLAFRSYFHSAFLAPQQRGVDVDRQKSSRTKGFCQ